MEKHASHGFIEKSLTGTVDVVRSTQEPGLWFNCRMSDDSWYPGAAMKVLKLTTLVGRVMVMWLVCRRMSWSCGMTSGLKVDDVGRTEEGAMVTLHIMASFTTRLDLCSNVVITPALSTQTIRTVQTMSLLKSKTQIQC